jgi:hypothetical protein
MRAKTASGNWPGYAATAHSAESTLLAESPQSLRADAYGGETIMRLLPERRLEFELSGVAN